MRRLVASILAAAAAAGLAIPALAATRYVKVSDNYYVREVPEGRATTVTVALDDTVRWRFVGRSAHTVTVRRGPVRFSSKVMTSGTYKRVMTRAGTYRIYCRIHGVADQAMVLKVVP